MRRAAPEGRFDRRLLPPMMLGAILNPINSSIIAVALVPIGAALGAPAAETAWLVTALYIATAIGQPLVGRLVDRFGPRRVYLVGTALTGVAGLLGMLAPGIGVLIVARVILGFGTCAGYPASMVLIRAEARRTGKDSPAGVLTALAVTTQTIAVIGPPLGGALVGLAGWRATFAVNVPLAVACLVLGAVALPRTAPERSPGAPLGIDLPGVLLFAATLVALLLLLVRLDPRLLWLLAVAAVTGPLFVLRELRCAEPFIDLRVLAGNVPLVATYARALVAQTVSYAFLYGYTQWLEDGRGLDASLAGLLLLPTFAIGIVVSAVTGRSPRVRAKLVVGSIVQLVVCGMLLLAGDGSPLLLLLVIGALLGVPQGLVGLANQNALYAQADPSRIGASAGLLRTFMYLGAMLASTASGALFRVRADTAGLHGLAALMLVAAAVFVVLTLADRSLAAVGSTTGTDGRPARAPARA